MEILIVTSHLYGLGGGARTVECIAKGSMRLGHHVVIGSLSPIPFNVQEWIKGVEVVPYQYELEKRFDILWNVNHFEYITPNAKRNLAFIFFPNRRNNPPPAYELYAVSGYAATHIETQWSRIAETLYLPVNKMPQLEKDKTIVNVARFTAPNEFADKAHIPMIETFEALQKSSMPDWKLTFIGGLDPGEGHYLDHLMQRAVGLNVEFLINCPQEILEDRIGRASFYWHMTGVGLKNIPGAQEHYGLTVLEAQTSGAVPIVHETGGMPETITQWYDGVLVKNQQGLYDVTDQLAKDLSRLALVSQRAIESSKVWLGEKFVRSLEEIYAETPISFVAKKQPKLFGKGDQSRVTVVMPVHNENLLTEVILSQIKTIHPDVSVIVVDNASTEDVHSLVEGFGYTYIRREVNDGFAPSIAAAFPYIKTDLTLLLNNDTMIIDDHKDWLDILMLEIDGGANCVAPKLIYSDGRIQFAGMEYGGESLFYHTGYGQADSPKYNTRKSTFALTGACLLTRTDILLEKWDSDFKWNYEDVAYCLKAGECVYQPASIMVHFDGVTKRRGDVLDDIEESKRMFQERYSELLTERLSE